MSPKTETVAPGVWPIAWTTLVGGLGVLFATTIVAVAVEPLAGILGVPLSTIQWISTGYLLALAVVIPIVPWAQRRLGGRRLWITGLALFLAASVLAAWAAEPREPASEAGFEDENLLLLARGVVAAAAARRHSVGAHFRTDDVPTEAPEGAAC